MTNNPLEWAVYEDNRAHGEDKSGVYDTFGGTLFLVADGASLRDGEKTGKDVVDFLDKRLTEESKEIMDWKDMEDFFYKINKESSEVNPGAYAAFASILHSGGRFYPLAAGDVSIIRRDNTGNLYQLLPLDLKYSRDEAIKMAKGEIGTRVGRIDITGENYLERANHIANHSLYNALGIGNDFFLRGHERLATSPGDKILIASDGITDVLMKSQRESGYIHEKHAEKLYEVMDSPTPEKARERLGEALIETTIEMSRKRKKVKKDDRTGLFLFVNNPEIKDYLGDTIPRNQIQSSLS